MQSGRRSCLGQQEESDDKTRENSETGDANFCFYSGFHLSEKTYRFLSRRPG